MAADDYKYNGSTSKDINGRGNTGHRVILRFVKLLDVIFVGLVFAVAWMTYYDHHMRISYYLMGNILVVFLYYVMYYLIAHLYGGFMIHIKTISELVYAQTLAVIITNFLMYIIMWMLFTHLPNIPIMLLVLAVQIGIIILWSYYSHKWYFGKYPAKPSVIIYDEMRDMDNLIHQSGLSAHF